MAQLGLHGSVNLMLPDRQGPGCRQLGGYPAQRGGHPAMRSVRRAVAATPRTVPPGPGSVQGPAVALEDSRMKTFLDWARGSKIQFNSSLLQPATFGGLRGIAATGPIRADDVLVSVPREVAIVLAPKQRNPCPSMATDAWWKSAPWFSKMAVTILYERSLGAKSRLATYLTQLPADPGVPVLWEHKQLQLLQYPYLIHQVKEQQNEWQKLYDTFLSMGLAPGAKAPSRADFYWAMACVRSRTFSGPYIGSSVQDRLRLAGVIGFLCTTNLVLGIADVQKTISAALAVFIFNVLYDVILGNTLKQYALCPLIDLFNHSSAVQSEVSFDYFSSSYTVAASKAFNKGEQVFISYGSQSNDSLMQYYGFAEADNPADVYVMTNLLKWLDQHLAGPVSQQRLDALNSGGLLNSLQLVTIQRAGFPPETLQALRYLLASDAEAAAGVGAFSRSASVEVETRLANLLALAVGSELAALGSSLQEDLLALQGGQKGSSAKRGGGGAETAALEFRIQKKRVLHAVLAGMGAGPA